MDAIFLKIVNMSIAASWLILAVILLRVVLKKAPKWINVLLWALVAVRLLCPISFESSLSLVPNAEPIPQEIFMMEPPENHESAVFDPIENPNLPSVPSVSVDTSIETIQWKAVFATFGWMFGMAAMLVYAAISYILVKRKVKASLHLRDNILICDDIQTPFILGAIKPRIYIPSGTDEAQLPHIIAHENAHLKRRDHWWKPLGFLVLAIHWFNPLVWVAYILLCRDIESACDEKVIRELNQGESIAYSEALLSCSVNRRMVMVCPLAFGEVGVKERVKRVLNYKKPAFWIVVVAVIASVILAVCFLTNPRVFGDSITLIEQSTPARGNAFTYDVSFGQNVMSGTVHAEQWSNGTCVKSSPVVLTNEVDEINILMNVRRENNSPVGVDIQVDTNEYGGSLITYFAFPENNSIIGWGCKGYALNEPVQIQPETEKILAAMVFDVGNGVRAFGTEDLIIGPERLENADYAIVIRASFDSTNLGNENNEATPIYSSFNATVLEIHDGYYLVEPVEGSWELSSSDRIEVPIRNAAPSPEPEVGDVIEIEYSGEILETYPARIAEVYGIRVAEENTVDLEIAIHNAIMEHNKDGYYKGVFACESHITLGTDSKVSAPSGNTLTIYLIALYQEYNLVENGIESVSGGCGPIALTFLESEDGYELLEYWEPRDGSYYSDDIRDKFPKDVQEKYWNADGASEILQAENEKIALEFSAQKGDFKELVNGLLTTICSDPLSSSNPGDYIQANRTEYDELLSYGDSTLKFCFTEFLAGNQIDLRGHIMASACKDIMSGMGEALLYADSVVMTGQDWFDAFYSNAKELERQYSNEDLEKYYPASWLLLQMISDEQPEVVHYPAHKTLYEATPIDQIEANYDNEEFVIAKLHYENLDGEWVCGEHTYKYRLEITGRLNNAAKNTTYIVLSNTKDITFDQTWKASGLSSNLNDYFDPSVAVIVGNRLFS